MTKKEYCSQICEAKCCKKRDPVISPAACPNLTGDNLCSIFEKRIGFQFDGLHKDGYLVTCRCSRPSGFLKTLSPEVRKQCCIAHPELLEQAELATTP